MRETLGGSVEATRSLDAGGQNFMAGPMLHRSKPLQLTRWSLGQSLPTWISEGTIIHCHSALGRTDSLPSSLDDFPNDVPCLMTPLRAHLIDRCVIATFVLKVHRKRKNVYHPAINYCQQTLHLVYPSVKHHPHAGICDVLGVDHSSAKTKGGGHTGNGGGNGGVLLRA